jgi:hypothetical protein
MGFITSTYKTANPRYNLYKLPTIASQMITQARHFGKLA